METSKRRRARAIGCDACRIGRTGTNPKLVGEIVRFLGSSDLEATQREERCPDARRTPTVTLDPVPVVGPEPTCPVPQCIIGAGAAKETRIHTFLGGILLYVLGFALVGWLELPLCFDMAGIAITVILLGPGPVLPWGFPRLG